jgi:hypothetical protein
MVSLFCPRAIWWGVEFIRFAAAQIWQLDDGEPVYVRGYNVRPLWTQEVRALPESSRKRVKYFRSFLETSEVRLFGVYAAAHCDGQRERHVEMVQEHNAALDQEELFLPEGFQIWDVRKFTRIGAR